MESDVLDIIHFRLVWEDNIQYKKINNIAHFRCSGTSTRPQPLASEGQGHLASKALKKKGAARPTERAPRPFSNLYGNEKQSRKAGRSLVVVGHKH